MSSSSDQRKTATVFFAFAAMLQLPALLVLNPHLRWPSEATGALSRAASLLVDAPVTYLCLYAPFRVCGSSPTIDSIRPALWASLIFNVVGYALDRSAQRKDETRG